MDIASLSTVLAEIGLALYPILIKNIPTNIQTQLLARLGTFSTFGYLLSSSADRGFSWGSSQNILNSILLGIVNLLHIGSSYLSYTHLQAGPALALFYIYPFFNILAGTLFLGERFDSKFIAPLILAFAGVILISKYTSDNGDNQNKNDKNDNNDNKSEDKVQEKNITLGILASIFSALTETIIFLVAKTNETSSPWLTILRLYPGALLALLGTHLFTKVESFDTNIQTWIPLILFNLCVGFIGYSLRFWSIPRLTTFVFSMLTFIGVISGYSWGLLYAKEIPSIGALVGSLCIVISNALIYIL
jgi:drug/metabolite transporter (DMT)-like permease